jgi:hypothetical protein
MNFVTDHIRWIMLLRRMQRFNLRSEKRLRVR